ncbi:MAG: hypothetical protein ACK49V_07820 [Actinomycetes bacterium]
MKRSRASAVALPVLVAFGLIATSCGDDPDASGPPVLVVSGSGMNAPSASADMAAGASESKMWAPWRMNFGAGADLPAWDSDAASYSISVGSFSAEDIADVAAAFGVTGEVVELDANIGGGYRIGSEDGSADSFWVSGDAMGYWSYSPKWDESMMSRGCAVAPSIGSDVVGETVTTEPAPIECETPQPPANVPSEDEALAMFETLMSELNLNADDMVLETYADEWSANVYGYLLIDGVRSPLTVNVGFGAQGAVTWASGFLGEVVRGADYPRIGTAAALERLNSDYANPMLRGGVAVDDIAVSSGVAETTASADAATSDTVVPVPVPSSDAPVETTPVDMPIETVPVEVQEVSIVAVEEELVMLYGQDGSIYLVPGYAFIAVEDEYGYTPRYTVSALPDEYVQQADPIDVSPEPAVEEPVPSDPVVTELAVADAETLVGLSESEALDTAKANGWDARVVSRDGEDFAITMDYRADRVNLTVVDDVVTASTVG